MRPRFVGRLLLSLAAAILMLLPIAAFAQEATLTGTVTDSSGAVLPGVTVTAVHEATGTSFLGVTDALGIYRIPVRIGGFRLTVELSGFATVTRAGVTLLVGQTATIDIQMVPSSVQESITVTAESPLIDTKQSTVGANLDSRQLSEIPLSGRNWVDLVMLAPGSRANEVGTNGTGGPVARTGRSGGTQGTYNLNLDGQQVTQTVAGTFTNPNFSRESIAEFQFISNRFDAAQGRSAGIQVNAVTKSGTNTPAGSFSGYFRDSRWGSPDFIRHTILPYSDQQLVGTFGGPIERDKMHSGDTRNVGSGGSNRYNPATGQIAPRNAFVGQPLHRVDLRILRRLSFGRRGGVDGIVEVFNLFNHVNYGNYVTTLGALNYGAPVAQDNVAYKPRQMQLGFRATF